MWAATTVTPFIGVPRLDELRDLILVRERIEREALNVARIRLKRDVVGRQVPIVHRGVAELLPEVVHRNVAFDRPRDRAGHDDGPVDGLDRHYFVFGPRGSMVSGRQTNVAGRNGSAMFFVALY